MKRIVKLIIVGLTFLAFSTTANSAELLGIDIHGFASLGYLQSSNYNYHGDTMDGTFQFNEFGINFAKELIDDLRVGLQLFSRDLGSTGNNEIIIDWAYGDYYWKDWLGFRAGKIKIPQGLYNETRDVDALRTWIFLPSSVYPETTRNFNLAMLALGFYGNVDMGEFGEISYQALGGTQELDDSDSRLGYHMRAATANYTTLKVTELTVDWRYALSLQWYAPIDGLRLGGTFNETKMYGAADVTVPNYGLIQAESEYNSVRNYVVSAEYVWNNLLLVAEYIRTAFDRDDNNNADFPYLMGNVKQETDGWYAGAAYRFTHWLEIGGYYSKLYNNVDDRGGDAYDPDHRAWLKDMCLSVLFDINEYLAVKLEGHALNGTTGLYPLDNLPDENEQWWSEGKDWTMFAAKINLTF